MLFKWSTCYDDVVCGVYDRTHQMSEFININESNATIHYKNQWMICDDTLRDRWSEWG